MKINSVVSFRRTILAGVVGCSVLSAGAAASAQTPAATRYFDETTLFMRLRTPDPMGGYLFRLEGVVYGIKNPGDAVRVDWKQNGRVLTSVRCPFTDHDGDAGKLECESTAVQTATGNVTAEVVFLDDSDDSTQIIRTMELKVDRYPNWVRNEGNRSIVGSYYQINGDDLLAGAFVWHGSGQQTRERREFVFSFWLSGETYPDLNNGNMRCTVNGQRIPDITGEFGNPSQDLEVNEWTSQQAPRRTFHWYQSSFRTTNLWHGARLDPEPSHLTTTDIRFAAETPGAWVCDMRAQGQVVRQVRFTVDAQGHIPLSPEQATIPSLPMISLVDLRLPSPDTLDLVVNPTAMRTSMWFGHRWGVPAAVKDMLDALPAARGSSAPSGARAGAAAPAPARGRRRH